MKKSLLTLAGAMLLSAAAADAAKVYFDNSNNWDAVYSYSWTPEDARGSFPECQEVEIDGHTLYLADINKTGGIIFTNFNNWDNTGQQQTGDLAIVDGIVYNAASQHIADIVDNKYVEVDDIVEIDHSGLYLRGGMNGWGSQAAWEFEKKDDNTIQIGPITILPGEEFKIGTPDWGTSYGKGGLTIQAGSTNTLENNGGNMKAGANLTDVYMTFDLSTMVLTVSDAGGEPPVVKWWCAWDLQDGNGWQFGNEFEAQEGEPGIYKISVETPSDSGDNNYFAVFLGVNNTDFGSGTRYTPELQQTIAVNEDGTYKMQLGSDGAWQLTKNGTWTVVIDSSDMGNPTISFDWGDSTGEANVQIDRVGDEDHSYESFAMEAVAGEDHVYTWSGELNEGDKLRFNIQGINYYYDPSIGTITSSAGASKLVIEYPLVVAEEDGEVTFNYSSTVKFVVDVTNTKVTATIDQAPDVTVTITNGEVSNIYEMVATGNADEYVWAGEVNPGDCVDFRIKNVRYVCEFVADPAQSVRRAAPTSYKLALVESDDEEAAPELPIESTQNVVFTINTAEKFVAYTPDVETGVEEIEVAAEGDVTYYNFQGVRVANPAEGAYIRVANGKASKVIVK